MALVSATRTTSTAQEPLLTYAFTTSPDPLKASAENPATPEERGELIFTVSRNSGTPADVEWIKVKVPAGTMAPDLATNLETAEKRITLEGWTAQLDQDTDEIVFTPAASHDTIGPDNGFTIQISQIPISRKVGTAPVTITESSRPGTNGAFQARTTEFSVGKFPADFYLRNLIVEPLVIDNGGQATLTWERSPNATYELLYGDTSLNVTNETTRTVTNIKSDTTFYLRGTTGDPTNPVTRILNTHITVRKPDLEVSSLTVHGRTILNSAALLNGATILNGPVTTNGAVTVNDDVTINSEKTLKVQNISDSEGRPMFLMTGGSLQAVNKISATKGVTVRQNELLEVNEIRPYDHHNDRAVNINGKLTVDGRPI
ncbi:hypothetical protein [Kitasatospora griseola]|uniref:hypothetical protein n=1 Tax=Kitasatospora griseola TaxID=2064 RepID=UPI00341D8D1F